jgi:hypothetical protein
MPLAEKNLTKMKDLSQKLFETQQEAIDQNERFGEERFGSFFRVKYFGDKFPEDIREREFIFREGMAAKLPEVAENIQKEASIICGEKVEIIKDSSDSQSRKNHTIHITFVKNFHHDWEEHQEGLLSKINLSYFMYATPFTESGKAHGNISDQQKRKTFLVTKSRLPTLIGRCEVKDSWIEILNPMQVAKEDIEAKTLALYHSLKSDDTRIIQLQLQGSIQPQVNQVKIKYFA